MNWTDAMLLMAVQKVPYEQHPLLWQKLINFHTQSPNLLPIQNINERQQTIMINIEANPTWRDCKYCIAQVPGLCETKLHMGL